MHMNMPHMNMPHMGGHGRHHRMPPVALMIVAITHCVFYAAATVCLLQAVNRRAGAKKLMARVETLKAIPEEFTEEERAVLVDKIKTSALSCW